MTPGRCTADLFVLSRDVRVFGHISAIRIVDVIAMGLIVVKKELNCWYCVLASRFDDVYLDLLL